MKKLALYRLRPTSDASLWENDDNALLGMASISADGVALECQDPRWHSWILSILDRPSMRFVGGGADGLECVSRDCPEGLEILVEHLYEGGIGVKGVG